MTPQEKTLEFISRNLEREKGKASRKKANEGKKE
jgi:hypothetical protein